MDQRLEEAAYAGDINALHQLLKEDKLLLHRPHTAPYPIDNPLHIAASLGHPEFAREILTLNSSLARSINGQGLSPLHLASANGHLMIVKELLSLVGSDLCVLHDKDGLLPIHTAAMNGKVDVLKELMKAHPESVHVRTCKGDGVLHLAVKFNHFEAVKFLVERMEEDEREIELLMSGDAKGNTILHLATAKKQFEILTMLLGKPWADVNALNAKGSTILDVFLESPYEHGDLMLGESIRAAGGRTSTEGDQMHQSPKPSSIDNFMPSYAPIEQRQTRNGPTWRRMLTLFLKYPLASVGLGYLVGVQDPNPEDYYRTAPDTLIIVATLIATITFQGGLNPPGGFATYEDLKNAPESPGVPPLMAGQALMGDSLNLFVSFDIIALLASLSVILMLICWVPKWKVLIRIMMWVTWIAFFFMGSAFDQAIFQVFPNNKIDFGFAWNIIAIAFSVWLCVLCVVYLLKKGRWLRDKKLVGLRASHVDDDHAEATLSLRRFFAGLGLIIVVTVTAGIIYFLVII